MLLRARKHGSDQTPLQRKKGGGTSRLKTLSCQVPQQCFTVLKDARGDGRALQLFAVEGALTLLGVQFGRRGRYP